MLYVEDGRVGAGFYAADFYSNIIKPKTSKRNGPYYFGSKKSIKHEIIVRFPEEIDFNEPDPVINLSNDSFEFNLTEDYYAKELHLNFSLLVKNTNVPLQDFKKTYQQIVKARDALYQNRTIPYIKELDDPEVQAMFEELY